MTPSDIRNAVTDFLGLIESAGVDQENYESQLVLMLDRLALAQNFISYSPDEDYHDAPSHNYIEVRELIAQGFPNYGHYNTPEFISKQIGSSGCTVGDALDDLADIYQDLLDVQWHWNHTNENYALWHFHDSYKTHWRAHLRSLQFYIHALEGDQ